MLVLLEARAIWKSLSLVMMTMEAIMVTNMMRDVMRAEVPLAMPIEFSMASWT